MREIFSFVFDKITDPLTLPIHPLYEWLILGVIAVVAYIIAYRTVGNMYASGNISGSFLGSLCHWIIRAFVFILLWFFSYWTIVIGQWIGNHIPLAIGILGGTVLIGTMLYFLFRYKIQEANR